MIDLSRFGSSIGKEAESVDAWFRPIFERGRAAVFLDTGFLRALIMPDQWSEVAKIHYDEASRTNFYTTTLVFSELVRQLAKEKRSRVRRAAWFEECNGLLLHPAGIALCAPPVDLVEVAYREFLASDKRLDKMDLCDAVSLKVLEYAKHRRVFGFDRRHWQIFGAKLEP